MTRTIEALESELGDDGLLRALEGRGGGRRLPAASVLARGVPRARGQDRPGREALERAAGAANDVGLLAEEVDPRTGEPLGNIPQAMPHIGLVNAAQALTEARERARCAHERPRRRRDRCVTGVGRATARAFAARATASG